MNTTTTVHCTEETRVFGEVMTLSDGKRFMSFRISNDRWGGTGVDFLINDTALLDMISNEAERLTREFIGDVPPLEPRHATGQHCECGECEVVP